MLHQFLETLRWVGAKHIAVLLHKVGKIRLFSPDLLVQHMIHVRQHLFETLHLFGRHIGHTLRHLTEHIPHGLLLEHVQQLVERLLRGRIKKLIVVQGLHTTRKIRRQVVQKLHALLSVTRACLAALSLLACLTLLPWLFLGPTLALLPAVLRSAGRPGRSLLSFSPLLSRLTLWIESVALHLQNVFQTLLQFIDERGEIVALGPFAALLLEALNELPNPFKTTPHVAPHPPPHQIA